MSDNAEGPVWTREQEEWFNAVAAKSPALRRALADYSDGDAEAIKRFLGDPVNVEVWHLLRENLPPPHRTR